VDRLSLFRLLADPSRYAIYQEVTRAEQPPSTLEISQKLGLHPSTVRLHLDKLRDSDLVRADADRHGTVGRPQYLWSAGTQSSLPPNLDPEGLRLLSQLLAELACRAGGRPDTAVDTGRQSGLDRVVIRSHLIGAEGRDACLEAVLDELTDLGFDPCLGTEPSTDDTVEIVFQRCPFRDLAVRFPDLVCQLHRGLTEGILEAVCAVASDVEGRISSFSSLVDEDPCRVGVSLGV
jgi:predicted ArsR family transcriptional regulator